MTTETAGQVLFDYLVELKQVGKLSAKDACQLAFWAVNAGAEGPCKQLGKAPGDKNTGNYSSHFDRAAATPVSDPSLMFIDVPQYIKGNGSREVRPLAVRPVFETLCQEVEEHPNFQQELERVAVKMPPVYRAHPVTQRSLPSRAVPLAFFSQTPFATRSRPPSWASG